MRAENATDRSPRAKIDNGFPKHGNALFDIRISKRTGRDAPTGFLPPALLLRIEPSALDAPSR